MGYVKDDDGLGSYARNLIRRKAWELVGNHGFTKSDKEDIEQELRYDLLRRLDSYSPDKASRNTFIARLIGHKISNLIAHQHMSKRDVKKPVESFDEEIDVGGESTILRHELISEDDYLRITGKTTRSQEELLDLRVDTARQLQKLSPLLQEVAELLQKMSISEASRTMGIPRTTINEYRDKIRRAFRKGGMGVYR